MPYAKKYNHEWNLQWYDSPFMEYKREKCKYIQKSRSEIKKQLSKLMMASMFLHAYSRR